MSQARDRLFRRLEKVAITFESIMVALFCGLVAQYALTPPISKAVFSLITLITFTLVILYKRRVIRKERKGEL